jgi:DNA-binding NtrC family response regulator
VSAGKSDGVALLEASVPKSILILSPDQQSRDSIVASVRKFNLSPHCCMDCRQARNLLQRHQYSVVLCSDNLTDGKYPDVITAAKPVPVVVFSRLADWGPYLEALHAGAFDYIACPPDAREMERVMTSALNENSRVLVKAASAC